MPVSLQILLIPYIWNTVTAWIDWHCLRLWHPSWPSGGNCQLNLVCWYKKKPSLGFLNGVNLFSTLTSFKSHSSWEAWWWYGWEHLWHNFKTVPSSIYPNSFCPKVNLLYEQPWKEMPGLHSWFGSACHLFKMSSMQHNLEVHLY